VTGLLGQTEIFTMMCCATDDYNFRRHPLTYTKMRSDENRGLSSMPFKYRNGKHN